MADSLKEVEEKFKIKLSGLNFKLGDKTSLTLSNFETPSLWNTVGELILVLEDIGNVKIKH